MELSKLVFLLFHPPLISALGLQSLTGQDRTGAPGSAPLEGSKELHSPVPPRQPQGGALREPVNYGSGLQPNAFATSIAARAGGC